MSRFLRRATEPAEAAELIQCLPANHLSVNCSHSSDLSGECSEQEPQSYQRCSDSSDSSDHFGRKGMVCGGKLGGKQPAL